MFEGCTPQPSEEAARAYAAANDQIERKLQTYPRCRKKNRYFLQRFKVQALYRRLLADGEKFSLDDRSEELPEEAEFWLRALVWKYLGALAAANGEREAAAQYFSKAVELLEGCDNDIIAFIRMTILAEEYRSLREERFRRAALDAAGALSGNYSAPLAPWRDYLSGGGAFPGLNYWY